MSASAMDYMLLIGLYVHNRLLLYVLVLMKCAGCFTGFNLALCVYYLVKFKLVFSLFVSDGSTLEIVLGQQIHWLLYKAKT